MTRKLFQYLSRHITSFQLILLSFLAIILLGTFLLSLPVSSSSGEWTSPADALFTAASASCVTGLIVHDTATYWSLFGKIIIFLLVDLIILLLGCIMDMSPIILITTPILLPIVSGLGMDPIQFGIIMVLNCGIGLLTPPVGAVLFIGSAVAKLKMEQVVKATLPFYLCMLVALILITFIPAISLALPNLLMPAG